MERGSSVARTRSGHARECGSERQQPAPPSEQRIAAIDTFRGLLLVMMAINHIPSDFRVLTDQPFGYFSAAEGFVFLSGLLAGKVYVRMAMDRGLAAAREATLARALHIHRAHLICIGAVYAWCTSFRLATGMPPPGSPDLFSERPLAALVAAATFVYRPGLFDILPLYCATLVILIAILDALRRGQSTSTLVVSGAVWVLANVYGGSEPYVDGLINTGAISVAAWQFLFVLGTVLGARWAAGSGRLRLPERSVLAALGVLAWIAAALRHGLLPCELLQRAGWLTLKLNLGPLRLLNLLLVFYLVALAVQTSPRRFSCRPLEYLGRRSLAVFTAHVIVAIILLGLPEWFEHTARGRLVGTAILIAAMYLTARFAALRSARRTRDATHAIRG